MKESKNRTQSSSAQYKKNPQKSNNSNCNLKRLLPFLSDKELYKIFSQEFPVAEGSVNKSTIWQGRK